jgi:hypothetical protein
MFAIIFNFLDFSFYIFLLFVPELSAIFTSYAVQIKYIALTWILYPLQFSFLPVILGLTFPHHNCVLTYLFTAKRSLNFETTK